MEKKRKYLLLTIALLLITAIACEISFAKKEDGPSQEEIELELARLSIEQTQTALAKPPEPEDPPPVVPDDDDEDDGQDSSSEDCWYSQWTGDETIADGTKFDPGDSFVKSWTLRNAGTCEWSTGTRMEFEDGNKMGASTAVTLAHSVAPGDTYAVEIPMTAPASDGDYTGVWRFKAADGTKMGKYWVMITVGNPAPPPSAFAVTSVSYSMPSTVIDIVCPSNETATITAHITTNGPGQVSFKWDDSRGCVGCVTKSMTFNAAETKSIGHTMDLPIGGSYWAKIYIDNPNHQWFGQQNFEAHCNP